MVRPAAYRSTLLLRQNLLEGLVRGRKNGNISHLNLGCLANHLITHPNFGLGTTDAPENQAVEPLPGTAHQLTSIILTVLFSFLIMIRFQDALTKGWTGPR